jgi:hypothetical protein
MTKIRLTVDVAYIPNGTSKEWLKDNLMNMVSNAIDNGLLTGESDAEVDTYNIKVEVMK